MQSRDHTSIVVARDVDSRRRYEAPSLIEYGPLTQLTATGSGGSSESGASYMNCTTGYKLHMAC